MTADRSRRCSDPLNSTSIQETCHSDRANAGSQEGSASSLCPSFCAENQQKAQPTFPLPVRSTDERMPPRSHRHVSPQPRTNETCTLGTILAQNHRSPCARLFLFALAVAVSAIPAHAQSFSTLHQFQGVVLGDGAEPQANLLDVNGILYDTTSIGGLGAGWVTAFTLDRTGKETLFYSFTGGADGSLPLAALVLDGKGNLYDTAPSANNFPISCCGP